MERPTIKIPAYIEVEVEVGARGVAGKPNVMELFVQHLPGFTVCLEDGTILITASDTETIVHDGG